MSEKLKFHRSRFFLRDSSQPRLLLGVELIWLILLVISGAVFYGVANRNLLTSYWQAHLRIKNVLEILLPALVLIHLGGLALGAVLTLFYTHRIAGPVYRLCRSLRQIGQGNLAQPISFRRGDELKELDAAVTVMVAELDQRVRRLQRLAMQIHREVETVSATHPALDGELTGLQITAHALETELSVFRLAADVPAVVAPSEAQAAKGE